MKNKIFYLALFLLIGAYSQAQQFIDKAVIEYEVKSNIKKSMGNGMWAEMFKDKLPEFKVGYYNFIFADNKSVYKFDHWSDTKLPKYITEGDENVVYYYDYNNDKFNAQKNVWGSNLNIADTINKLHWKIDNEYRVIAGFNCRKAQAILFDSVYVFAFYTDEITIPGGPVSIHGLPGMIMGVTIPRLYTSWIATKVTVNNVNVSAIKPVSAKTELSLAKLDALIKDRTKDWYSSDDPDENKDIQEQKNRFIWLTLL
jgi:GLPGLI family protein